MKKPWLAALLNFFFMGLGTLVNGRRVALGAALTVAALALTYVETHLQTLDRSLWAVMFGTVFLMNTFLAVDGYREAQAINSAR
jgi:hypothetical protein